MCIRDRPKDSFEDEEDDPRANLIKRLQEYQRFKTVSENIAIMPMVDRDIYVASAQRPELKIETRNEIKISIDEVRDTIKEFLNRPNYKSNHLTYIGDSEIGKSVNIGAGTITCNYDGVKKSKTKIKDNVFIGSNSSLVAPLTIEENSVVGAGSVITKNVKKKSLALTRSLQTEIKNYKRKSK